MAPLNMMAMEQASPSPLPQQCHLERTKPDLSLDIAASGTENAFSCLSDMSRIAPDSENSRSLEMACRLVQKLLDQVAWHDAPPGNEAFSEDDRKLSRALLDESQNICSRQCHIPPSSSESNDALLETTTESNDPSDLWMAHYYLRCNPPEQKLGNAALATLCSRTLETVGIPSQPPRETSASWMNRQHSSPTKSPKSPWNQSSGTKKGWLRLRTKKQSPPDTRDPDAERNTAEGRDDPDTKPNSFETTDFEPRLQMFGSEYARYLSTTAFAPKDTTIRNHSRQSKSLHPKRRGVRRVQNLEETDDATLTGAITDILITHGEDLPPKGYYRISQSGNGQEFSLRDKKTPVYLNVKKESNWDRAAQRPCVTALVVIFPERKEFVPPGFSVVRRFKSVVNVPGDSNAANLSFDGEPVYLCFRRSREGNPITGIMPLQPSQKEPIPEGYTVLERTPRNFVANLQTGTGAPVFLAYRQRLANLEPLRPIPLVISVHKSLSSARRLHSYYCTGGTVVQSKVGRFHIMDRSTHSLLSPSSVSNRLSLIEISRRKMFKSISRRPSGAARKYSSSAANVTLPPNFSDFLTSSLLLAHGLERPATKSVASDLEKLSMLGDYESVSSADTATSQSMIIFTDDEDLNQTSMSIVSEDDSSNSPFTSNSSHSAYSDDTFALKHCLEALSFIPVVSTTVNENDPNEMFLFQARVSLLTPVLTACYTRHGGSALIAVEGLTTLLCGNFFSRDLSLDEKEISSRLTLLDVAVQVVCDVATTGAQETYLHACVEFVKMAVQYGSPYLNKRTIGFVLRFYLFVFYFGASTPARGSNCGWGKDPRVDEALLKDPRNSKSTYLPGGAPQLACLSLKELISFSIMRLRLLSNASLSNESTRKGLPSGMFNSFLDELLSEVVDESVNRVEVANFTQLAIHQIHRSGGSELFWYDMLNSCGKSLFGNDTASSEEERNAYTLCFALLANLVKVASTKLRRDKQSDALPRDLASKLLSLELLHHFLEKWGAGQQLTNVNGSRLVATFAFCVRRLLTHSLIFNTREGLDDPRIFRRLIRIIGILWRSPIYRHHMKLELGILFEHFVLRVLQLGPQLPSKTIGSEKLPPLLEQQIDLMSEIRSWFSSDPRELLELFLNYDSDSYPQNGQQIEPLSGIQWKIVQQLIASLCGIAEQCGDLIGDQIRQSESIYSTKAGLDPQDSVQSEKEKSLDREAAQRLRKAAIETILQIAKSLAEAGATPAENRFRSVLESWATPRKTGRSLRHPGKAFADADEVSVASSTSCESDEDAELHGEASGAFPRQPRLLSPKSKPEGNISILGYWQQAIVKDRRTQSHVLSVGNADDRWGPVYSGILRLEDEEEASGKNHHLGIAFDIAKAKSLSKAIDYLIACNVLTPSPRDIASFLRIHRADLRPSELGKYLGEGGKDGSEAEYWNLIRFSFIRANSFVGMTLEQGLRHLLTNCGFHLPGEAQQIDRLLTTFAQCYWEDNAGDKLRCPFHDQDTAFLLSFAIIMLNTDLHKSSLGTGSGSRKPRKRMTKAEFLHNLRGVGRTEELTQDYVFAIYDSIEASPIRLHYEDVTDATGNSEKNLQASLSSMLDNVKTVDALLRGLSIHAYRFSSVEDYSENMVEHTSKNVAMCAISRNCFVKIWHHVHGLINAAIETAHLDSQGMKSCVDILKYTLCLTIAFEMPIERTAFLDQLGRIKSFSAWKSGETRALSVDHESYKHESWYLSIEEALSVSRTEREKAFAMEQLDQLVRGLGSTIATEVDHGRKAMEVVTRRIQKGEYLLNDPGRLFVRQGNLMKRSNRSGRCIEYRFFLFSDMLVYAKKINGGTMGSASGGGGQCYYKIHEELPLMLMKVVDWFPREMKKESKRGFQIYHPRKKFMVYCSSREERQSWVSAIRKSIRKEVDRRVSMEAARKAASKSH